MHLRKLDIKDAPLMLSWMHDESVVDNLHTDFSSKSLKDCENFIAASQDISYDAHFAIASDDDEYMGTVSLKHIKNGSAEFAIAIRKEAMGRGYSWFGMKTIIEKAFCEYGLESVYWCVLKKIKKQSGSMISIIFMKQFVFHPIFLHVIRAKMI